MRILLVCDYYQYLGGAEQYIISLSESLESLGHKISVIYGIKTQDTLKINGRGEYFLPAITEDSSLDKSTRKKSDDIVREENPDIIYIHNVSNPSIIEYLSRLKPTVRFIHDLNIFCLNWRKILPSQDIICRYSAGFRCIFNTYFNRCISRRPLIAFKKWRFMERQLRINRKLDKLIVASNYMKTCLVQNAFSPEKIEVLPYYTEPIQYNQVNFNDFILFVGRIHDTKGLQHLLLAVKDCPETLNLAVIGEGNYYDEIKKLILQQGLSNRIEFLGWLSQEKLSEYYVNCLSLIIPSLWPEPFGIVGIEAVSYRKPVIAFDVGGISDWLKDNVNGFLVERKDVNELAEKIKFLFYNKEKARKMGEEGEKIFKNQFTKDKHINRLLETFNVLKQ